MGEDQTLPSIVAGGAERSGSAPEVQGANCDIDGTPAYIIADVSRGTAWVAVPDGAELDVADWC